jgi:hypothetical protein
MLPGPSQPLSIVPGFPVPAGNDCVPGNECAQYPCGFNRSRGRSFPRAAGNDWSQYPCAFPGSRVFSLTERVSIGNAHPSSDQLGNLGTQTGMSTNESCQILPRRTAVGRWRVLTTANCWRFNLIMRFARQFAPTGSISELMPEAHPNGLPVVFAPDVWCPRLSFRVSFWYSMKACFCTKDNGWKKCGRRFKCGMRI